MRPSRSKTASGFLAGLVGLLSMAVLAACATGETEPTGAQPDETRFEETRPEETRTEPSATGSPTSEPTPPATAHPAPVVPEELIPAWEAVIRVGSLQPEQVTLEEYQAVEWSDSCLGAAQPDEMCLQVITPGFRVIFKTLHGEVVVHTDRSGQIFRIVEGAQP